MVGTKYITGVITGACSVSATFTLSTYTLTYTAGANGSITGTSQQTVNNGANATQVTAVPATGYHFVNWSDAVTANPRTDTNVTGNVTVTANFAIDTRTITQIVIDPTTPTTLYSAIDGGGVYKKVGAGNWAAATTQPANLNVKALAISSTGTTLYAGTDGGGVFKSIDSGDTWAACATPPATINIRSLTLSGSTLYAGTTAGVFTSGDGCGTWAAMSTGLP